MTFQSVTPAAGTIMVWHHPGHWSNQLAPVTAPLSQKGYEVISIRQESEVMRQVVSRVPDLLLIHLQATRENGYALCERLRKLSKTSHLPIVFVGTRGQKSELVNALRCGGDEYLKLPMDKDEIWLRLERHLQTSQLVRNLQADRAGLHHKIWEYNHLLWQQKQLKDSLAKENEALQRLAYIDGLTQVANRRGFNERIAQLWQASHHSGQPVSLLLCDIDYFKRYNDAYGHIAGDGCLQAVAAAMVRGAHRHSDQVARYGGEEFAILLPETDLKGAQQVALAVQSELACAQIPHAASLVNEFVSLSIGICTLLPESAEQPYEVLIHGADEALYTAKLRGRNGVVVNAPEGLISLQQTHCTYDHTSDLIPASARIAPEKLALNQSSDPLLLDPLPEQLAGQLADRLAERSASQSTHSAAPTAVPSQIASSAANPIAEEWTAEAG